LLHNNIIIQKIIYGSLSLVIIISQKKLLRNSYLRGEIPGFLPGFACTGIKESTAQVDSFTVSRKDQTTHAMDRQPAETTESLRSTLASSTAEGGFAFIFNLPGGLACAAIGGHR
jgi:hypothetical protein